MEKFINPILNNIANLNFYVEIPSKYYYLGYEKRRYIKSVELIEDKALIAKYQENKEITLTVSLNNNKKNKILCSCSDGWACVHRAALLYYLKENIDILDFDYALNNNTKTLDFTNILLNNLKANNYINNNRLEEKKISALHKMLADNFFSLYKKEKGSAVYILFFKSLNYFLNIDFFYFDRKQEYIDIFFEISQNNLTMLAEVINQINIDAFVPILLKAKEYIDDSKKCKNYLHFLISFIKEIVNYKSTNYNQTIYTLASDSLALAQNYLSEEEYIDYFKNLITYHSKFEVDLIFFLFSRKLYPEVYRYINSNRRRSSIKDIALKAVEYKENKISEEEFIEAAFDVFFVTYKYDDVLLIYMVVGEDRFLKYKDQFLKIAKRKNKFAYYRLEILIDYENAYQLIKQAGIFEMNNHVDLFLTNKEEDLIFYYQEQLTNFFATNKSIGVRFFEAIKACDKLKEMKNGKYYLFSVYRMAKIKQENYSESLYELNRYIDRLEL